MRLYVGNRHFWRMLMACFLVGAWSSTALGQQETDGESPSSDIQSLSETQTSYTGAQLLRANTQVSFDRMGTGFYDDERGRDRYAFWEGDSLFVGVIDEESSNRVDAVAEFYWFESSLPRDSDFYVVVLKVASAPTPGTNWRIASEPSVTDQILFRNIGPIQRVRASMDRNGGFGTIRWDWSVPYQSYRWEPSRVIEVEQEYTAGANVEGTAMRSVTEGVNIQAKGFMNTNHRVSTRYTITLWRWEMRVQPGATDMEWNLTALDPEHDRDPAYHEYFMVIQAARNSETRIESLDFGGNFRERRGGWADSIWPDRFLPLSVRVHDILLSPPHVDQCDEGFVESDGDCVPLCQPGFKPQGGDCIPDCAEGFVPDGNECIPDCEEGFEPSGNRCVAICEDGERYSRGRCVDICEDGERLEGDECVPICAEGEALEQGRCMSICDEGESFTDGECTAICGEGRRYRDGDCVLECDEGEREVNGRCELDCGPGERESAGRCIPDCGPGFRAEGGDCVLDCPPGTRAENDRCVRNLICGEGTHLESGRCVENESLDTDTRFDDADAEDDEDVRASSAQGGCAASPGRMPSSTLPLLLLMLGILARRHRRMTSQN